MKHLQTLPTTCSHHLAYYHALRQLATQDRTTTTLNLSPPAQEYLKSRTEQLNQYWDDHAQNALITIDIFGKKPEHARKEATKVGRIFQLIQVMEDYTHKKIKETSYAAARDGTTAKDYAALHLTRLHTLDELLTGRIQPTTPEEHYIHEEWNQLDAYTKHLHHKGALQHTIQQYTNSLTLAHCGATGFLHGKIKYHHLKTHLPPRAELYLAHIGKAATYNPDTTAPHFYTNHLHQAQQQLTPEEQHKHTTHLILQGLNHTISHHD